MAQLERENRELRRANDEGEHATMTITLPADQVNEVAGTAERIGDQMNPQGTPEHAPVGFWIVPPVRFELTLDGF